MSKFRIDFTPARAVKRRGVLMRTLHGSISMQIDGSGAKDFYRDLRDSFALARNQPRSRVTRGNVKTIRGYRKSSSWIANHVRQKHR